MVLLGAVLCLCPMSCEQPDEFTDNTEYDPNAVLHVKGSLVDVRQVGTDQAVYPQNDDVVFTTSGATILGTQYKYATSLIDNYGVKSVSADRPTIIRIVLPASVRPDAEVWTDANVDIRLGSADYRMYSYHYTDAGTWMDLPSTEGEASILLLGRQIEVEDVPPCPGVLIAQSQVLRARMISNPSIMILDNGDYLVGSSGPDPVGNSYFRSADRGKTWTQVSNPDYMNFCKLFEMPGKDGILYELGVSAGVRGDFVIRSTGDEAVTFTPSVTLFEGGFYHGAPTPYVEYDGRIWKAMGTSPEEGMMGILLLSIPSDADPMVPSNWTMSNIIEGNTGWIPENPDHVFNQWQEGCIVIGPDGKLKIVARIDDSKKGDIAAIIDVVDENTISFDPENIIEMPGGGKKFTILYDEQSQKYWTLVNPCYEEDLKRTQAGWYEYGINPLYLRCRLVLASSPDLRTWTVEKEVITSNNCFFHGWQYVDWVFDGDDIIAVSRTAFSESRGLPNRQHDANMLTFHRIPGFRTGAFETETVTYDQLAPQD